MVIRGSDPCRRAHSVELAGITATAVRVIATANGAATRPRPPSGWRRRHSGHANTAPRATSARIVPAVPIAGNSTHPVAMAPNMAPAMFEAIRAPSRLPRRSKSD